MNRIFVHETLTAWHTDPLGSEGRHSHTWKVTAYFRAEPFRDKRALKASLRMILDAWEGRDLPSALWADEAIALAVLQLHGNADCIGVTVDREGFGGVEFWR